MNWVLHFIFNVVYYKQRVKIMEKLFRRPRLIVGIIVAVTVFFGAWISQVELDNNNMRFLPEKNSARLTARYIDETFGGQVIILVGLERPYRTVFERDFLDRIKEYSQAVEAIEYIKNVNSIMSTQYITGDSDSIIVTDLVPDDFTGSEEDISELRRRIASWDLFRGALVSDDLSATQILITLDIMSEDCTKPEVIRSLDKIRDLSHEKFDDLAEVYITGQPVISAIINESLIADNLVLIPMVVFVLLAVLFFSFRRFRFVTLPLLTVAIAVIWAAGAAALLGIKFSIFTTLMPVILLAVGSAYGIHVVTHYARDAKPTHTPDEHRAVVFELMRKIIKPVALAALTTLAGFISFCFTPIVPIREFGYCASMGVVAAFTVAVTFIPSMFLIWGPLKPKVWTPLALWKKQSADIANALNTNIENIENNIDEAGRSQTNGEDRLSNAIARIFLSIARRKNLVLAITAVVAGISIYGLSRVIVDNVLVEYFQNETDISRSDRFIREYFGGSKELNLVIEADTPEELLHPAVLKSVDNLAVFLERIPDVGKVVGFTDIIKRINQVFNVDESPDGLQPSSNNASRFDSDDSGGFGFSDFGFGDSDASGTGGFGFGDFGFSDTSDTFDDTPKNENHHDLTQYSAADLLRFLDTAAGKSSGLNGNDLVRELKRLTNYEGMAYYEIPSEPRRYGKDTPEELQRLISNYLVLLAGDDNSGYSNDPLEPTSIRMMIQLRATGNKDTQAVIKEIHAYIASNFPKNVRVIIGGGAMAEAAVTDLVVNSSLISIGISILIVFLIVSISNKSAVAGFIGAAPLALAILCNFAVMGFTGIKLNIATALMGSLAVGIGIDYTIHFIEFFKREYKAGQAIQTDDFLRRTFVGCGKAIIINALSVGAGFGVLAFSRFRIIAELGVVIALCMLITATISLTVIPALLAVIKPKFIYRQGV